MMSRVASEADTTSCSAAISAFEERMHAATYTGYPTERGVTPWNRLQSVQEKTSIFASFVGSSFSLMFACSTSIFTEQVWGTALSRPQTASTG